MKFPVNNQAVISKLSARSLKKNKVRNIFAVVAIILTTVLFTSIFTIGIGAMNSFEESTFRMVGGYSHGGFKYLTLEQYEEIKAHPDIKAYGMHIPMGIAENKELLKHHTEIRYSDENAAKWMYIDLEEGRMPIASDEVVMDTLVLELLGVPAELGSPVTIEYMFNQELVTKELTVVGIYERAQGVSVSQILVSKSFMEENLQDMNEEEKQGKTGMITMDVMLKNTLSLETTIGNIAYDFGYEPDGNGENGINVGINWGYSNAREITIDPMMLLAGVGGCMLVIFTGYLMIYNVFQISVMSDIRYYGLLKTIGTTPKQINKMMKRQAWYLSLAGIPVGLVLGYVIGTQLLGFVMQSTNYPVAYGTPHPAIFIGSAVFSLITVAISCRKPAKLAASISPIEAAKYTEVSGGKKKTRHTKKTNLVGMAYRNVTRNKKKSVIIMISLSLSLIMLNSVYTYTQGFDMDKYLAQRVAADFTVAHANYFNVGKGFKTLDDVVDGWLVEELEIQEGFVDGGLIQYNVDEVRDTKDQSFNQVYGLSDYFLDRLNIIDGEFDVEKFMTGDYVLQEAWVDDYGNVDELYSKYQVGDQVELAFTNSETGEVTTRTVEVMARIEVNSNATVRYSWGGAASLYLPEHTFVEVVGQEMPMAYFMEVDDAYEVQMQEYLEELTDRPGMMMHFESKQSHIDDFNSNQSMFLITGGVASFVIGMIGCFNLINVLLTSILARRGEFAMLQSVGMTTRQLRKILVLEGLIYTGMAVAFSFVLSIVTSYMVVKPFGESLWFFTYRFEILPIVIISPIVLLLGVSVPAIIYHITGKASIVERLRKVD